jgi:ketosteroid isomerase-like protein
MIKLIDNLSFSTMSYLQKTRDLHALLDQGRDLEALDMFFHEEVSVREMPGGVVRHGIEAQKEAVRQFMQMTDQFHASATLSVTSNEEEGISMAETLTELTFKGAAMPSKMPEVVVYRWRGDKIISMDFYFHDTMLVPVH